MPRLNPDLAAVLLTAYKPCPAFSGPCASMRWNPAHGHVPRVFVVPRAGWRTSSSFSCARNLGILMRLNTMMSGRRPRHGMPTLTNASAQESTCFTAISARC